MNPYHQRRQIEKRNALFPDWLIGVKRFDIAVVLPFIQRNGFIVTGGVDWRCLECWLFGIVRLPAYNFICLGAAVDCCYRHTQLYLLRQ